MQHPTSPARPVLAVALAAGAIGGALGAVATTTFLRPEASSSPSHVVDASGRATVPRENELTDRLDAIEARLDTLELAPPSSAGVPAARVEGAPRVDASRLELMEATVEKLAAAEAKREEEIERQRIRREEREEERQKHAEVARAAILDPTSSLELKMAAWGELRSVKPWGDEVVAEMIRIGETAEDEDVRADVWRQADGRDENTLLVPPMLRALQSDPSAQVRSEAAETLQNYLGEPGVEAALRHAAANDVSEDVREQAAESLTEG